MPEGIILYNGHSGAERGGVPIERRRVKELEEGATSLSRGIFAVVLAYALVASLWILLSDRALGVLFSDPAALMQASMVKGWFFVAITTVLLYFLVRRLLHNIQNTHRREVAALEEQQKALDLLTALVENSGDAIYAKDRQGRYLLFNTAACAAVGKPAKEVLGRDDRDIFPADQARTLMDTDRHAMAAGKTETSEEALETTRGRRYFVATKGPLRDVAGNVVGLFGISRDITERKQAELDLHRSNERLQRVVDNTVVGVMFWDTARGRLMNANDTFLELVGYDRHDVEAGELTWQRLTPPEYIEVSQAEMVNLRQTGRIGPYQKEYLCKDGRRLWLLFAGSSLDDDTAIEFCIDISALKSAEAVVQARNAELERFNRIATKRELRMIALKHEVNAMACELGRPAPYDLSFAEELGEMKTP